MNVIQVIIKTTELKIYDLSYSISTLNVLDIAALSSMQEACHI